MSEIEVDEVFRLCEAYQYYMSESTIRGLLTVCDEAAKVSTYYTMPCCAFPLVELWLGQK